MATLKHRTVHVQGMTCDGCERTIEGGLGELPGVQEVHADHRKGIASNGASGRLSVLRVSDTGRYGAIRGGVLAGYNSGVLGDHGRTGHQSRTDTRWTCRGAGL